MMNSYQVNVQPSWEIPGFYP